MRMDFERSFCTWRFLMIVLLIPVLMVCCKLETVRTAWSADIEYGFFSSIKLLEEILIFDRFKTVMTVLLSAICCFTVSDDIRTRYNRMILSRMGIYQYCISKLVMNALAVMAAVILGFVLFLICMLFVMPITNEEYAGCAYFVCTGTGSAVVLTVIWAYIFALYIILLTTFSIWISVYRPSRYVAIALPFALFYVLYALTVAQHYDFMNFWYISSGVDVLQSGNVWAVMAYATAVFGMLTCLCGLGFCRAMVRRMRDGRI